ncbi:hypothetical protein LMG23992_03283 [Cupriavidus laharis]|uniref:Uncharacterized protein n=1 Tax=Cupriavidus laharis TaxID=151654 RepID=A0ABN7YSI8_9BURK|nr:hypothetical protein LMG23992_03283 [Cupriavidus laharis]
MKNPPGMRRRRVGKTGVLQAGYGVSGHYGTLYVPG